MYVIFPVLPKYQSRSNAVNLLHVREWNILPVSRQPNKSQILNWTRSLGSTGNSISGMLVENEWVISIPIRTSERPIAGLSGDSVAGVGHIYFMLL